MKITESAVNAILEVMKKRKLDPKKIVFDFHLLDNGGIGIGFSRDRHGQVQQYGELTVTIGSDVDMGQTVVDFGEINGRKGIIFLEKKEELCQLQ